ncbi:MAG: O-antigen ligase family protein [Elusimicrobia bacterium]|nr:O-antigen ligase family protein [Elusimicrobiota bacterium]
MLLPALVALPVAVGPLLRGAWDPWAQALVCSAVSAGGALWLALRVLVGYIPRPALRQLWWTAALAALGGLAAWTGPLAGEAPLDWPVHLVALFILAAVAVMDKDERETVDQAVRAVAWVLMALAFYQRIALADDRPESALVNANIWAGTILMLLPLAADRRDWLLAAGLLVSLWWTKSVGAWLALFAALLLTARWRGELKAWAGLAGSLLCLVFVYNKFQSPEVLDRLAWWEGAARMAWQRPWTGFGPGSFAAALPGFQSKGLGTVYAHQYPLQSAAEYGIPFALLWFGGLWRQLWKGRSYKRFGALAVLLQSLWDWPLSLPANLWLFCWLAGSASPESGAGVGVRSRWKIPVAGACAAAGLAGALAVAGIWEANRAKARAVAALGEGLPRESEALAQAALDARPRDSEAALVLAQALLTRASAPDARGDELAGAARAFERSLAANPYRPRAWRELASVYQRLGDAPKAQAAMARGALSCPSLRAPPGGGS